MTADAARYQRVIEIADDSAVGEAKRCASALTVELGGDETAAGRAAIVAAELASNVLKHAGEGVLVLRRRPDATGSLELLALDRGKGIASLTESMRDGYSTAGSPGTGLGAIRRLSSEFDIFAAPGRGTAVLSRVRMADAPQPWERPAALAVGALSLPLRGEPACGDDWAVRTRRGGMTVLVADGLGHGPKAAEAAAAAVAAFREQPRGDPEADVHALDSALRRTRGAALAVADILPANERLVYAGLGNIAGRVYGGPRYVSLVSLEGTAGSGTRRTRTFEYDWPPGAVLVMHTDGVASRWDLDAYPGLLGRDPVLIAGVLLRDARRERDDATVLVVRDQRAA